VRRPFAVTVALATLVPLACGTLEDASLCTAFDEFLGARADIQTIDPTEETAADAIEIAEDYLASVRRLEQAADGRYGQQIEDLETAVNDVLLTLESVQADAEYDTWSPLVEDDLELAADAAEVVEETIRPSCEVATSEPTETSESSGTSGT
jgi:hypothetical protein